MPFIKYFHALHLLKSESSRWRTLLKIVNMIYISTTYLAQTFDIYVSTYVYKVTVIMKGMEVSNNRFQWLCYVHI